MPICGLITGKKGRPVAHSAIEAMCRALRPDAPLPMSGVIVREGAGLSATSAVGADSVCYESPVAAVVDSDFLNKIELCSLIQLETSATPAQIVAALYRRFGDDFVKRIEGTFSCAVWDEEAQKLLLAVDRFGVRPLSYALIDHGVVFGSRTRAVFKSGCVEKEVDLSSLVNFLNFTVVPVPLSGFKSVQRLAPGCYITWQNGDAKVRPYWDLEYPEDARGSEGQMAARLLEEMEQAVRLNVEGLDRRSVGCFLSGGTDSSSVTGLVTKAFGGPTNTFSIGFKEDRFNELEYAHAAVKHFGSKQHEFLLGAEDTYRLVEKVVDVYDEPFANSSAIPTYYCLELAKKNGVEWMLAGDGGDELFGGNSRYSVDAIFQAYHQIPRPLRKGLIEPVLFGSPFSASVVEKGRRYVRKSNTPNPDRYFAYATLNVFPPDEILGSELGAVVNGDHLKYARAHYKSAKAHSELNRLLYIDIKMTLADNDLPKVVGMSELAGVKVRFPFLSTKIAEFSGQIPAKYKVRRFEKRYLFKKATQNLLPQSILTKKKHGFGLPIGLWFKEDPKLRKLAEDVLLDPRSLQRGYVSRTWVERLFRLMDEDNTPYYGDILWLPFMLELWHRRHVEGGSA